MDDLGTFLQTTAASGPRVVRGLAASLLQELQSGIVPNVKKLTALQRYLEEAKVPRSCDRLEDRQACSWLRRRGVDVGMAVPPAGQPATCPFVSGLTFAQCDGYRENWRQYP